MKTTNNINNKIIINNKSPINMFSSKYKRPLSFLTGKKFKPNSSKPKYKNPSVKCLLTRSKTKEYMQNTNKIYYDNKIWTLKKNIKENNNNNNLLKKYIKDIDTLIYINKYKTQLNSPIKNKSLEKSIYKQVSKSKINNNINNNNNNNNNNYYYYKGINNKYSPRQENKIKINDMLNTIERLYSLRKSNDNKSNSTTITTVKRKDVFNLNKSKDSKTKVLLTKKQQTKKKDNIDNINKKQKIDYIYNKKHSCVPDLHENYGYIPQYLIENKTRCNIEKEYKYILNEDNNLCNLNLSLLEKDVKNKYLEQLKKYQTMLLSELSKLPISADIKSDKSRLKKIDLEKKLNYNEMIINKLSRNFVCVKIKSKTDLLNSII